MRPITLSAIAAAALSMSVALPAIAQPLQHFTRDGDSYSYVVDRAPGGVILLRGSDDTTGDDFRLRVRGDRVEGTVGASSVAFRVSPEAASQLAGIAANPVALAAD